MGSTWGLLIPAAILMARLRNKKGWWFQLHRALATASLFLVVIGAVLGRRLRLTHPPVTTAGKLHKLFGYTALTFICLQVGHIRSALFVSCICITSVAWLGHAFVHQTIVLVPTGAVLRFDFNNNNNNNWLHIPAQVLGVCGPSPVSPG